MPVLIDSSVLLDIATNDPKWSAWSIRTLSEITTDSVAVINPIIYAEVSIGFQSIEDLEEAIPADLFRRDPLPYEAGFLAGKAFAIYRRRGGARSVPLPDFYIGAHAAVAGFRLLTRDPTRFRTYFPKVEVIAPGK